MGRTIVITTPENVPLEYPLAGLGSRFLAVAVDTALQAAFLGALGLVGLVLGYLGGLSVEQVGASIWAAAVAAVLLTLNGYFILFEALWQGQTPGKRLVGLRVLREGGHPLDFRGSLVRNVVRLLDFMPGMYGLGILMVFFHPEYRRVGDLAAGTFVVREREGLAEAAHSWEAGRDVDPSVPLPVGLLAREHLDLAESFLRRRHGLDPSTRARMASEIAWRLRAAMDVEPGAPGSLWPPEDFLETLVARRAAQAGL